MPHWYIKAATQGILSLLPQPTRTNYIFQRYVSKGLRLTDTYFENKLELPVQHLKHYWDFNHGTPSRVIELGTGWLPIVPIALILCGVEEVISIDINPLLRKTLVWETIEQFAKYAKEDRLNQHLPDIQPERVNELQKVLGEMATASVTEILSALHITPVVADARKAIFKNIDLIVSNNTLEHIPSDTIESIFRNFSAALNSDGLMSHLIDLADHYSYFDHNLTPYNFLQYSSKRWSLYNNRLQYQNRLRVSDYRAIHERSGYAIVYEDSRPETSSLIDSVKLTPEFARYSPNELVVTTSWMVSRPVSH